MPRGSRILADAGLALRKNTETELLVLKALRDSVLGPLTADGIRENIGRPGSSNIRIAELCEKCQIMDVGGGYYTILPPGLYRIR